MLPKYSFINLDDYDLLVSLVKQNLLTSKFHHFNYKTDFLIGLQEILYRLSFENLSSFDLDIYLKACDSFFDYFFEKHDSIFTNKKQNIHQMIDSTSLTSHTILSHPVIFLAKLWIIILTITEEIFLIKSKEKLFEKKNEWWSFFNNYFSTSLKLMCEHWKLLLLKKCSFFTFLKGNLIY